jgi:nitroimidazol reductase NimA-like FMN-containing flavoprotein (pyridoxamine 5'-phosphate oxidase superfamily)
MKRSFCVGSKLEKTIRTTLSRHTERGSYDRDLAYAILDEGLVAHVGLDAGDGVMVIPMTYARIDDHLYLHGALASRWLSSFETGRPISVCVTLLDGLVLAKSAFSHSMNYRSVVVFGKATLVAGNERKQKAFKALLDHLVPGRWDDSRQPDRKETDATTLLSVPINEASVKVRSGPPKDTAKDLELPYWTGVIPLKLSAGQAKVDPAMLDERAVPDYVIEYVSKRS